MLPSEYTRTNSIQSVIVTVAFIQHTLPLLFVLKICTMQAITSIVLLLLASFTLAHPGQGNNGGNQEQCKTSYITSSTCYTTDSIYYVTSTADVPITTESCSTRTGTVTLTSYSTAYVTTSYPVTSWATSVSTSICDVPYPSKYTTTITVPVTITSAETTVATETKPVTVTSSTVIPQVECCEWQGSRWGPWIIKAD
jgi:hypothetical protein